ncbi:MAG TPA: hypothetical protein VFT43_13115, partial [Candidatus Polarisedimenticolia bacterium]|nr:hypothetical protein [Candidatus Polarisedimenticolia bacterium]
FLLRLDPARHAEAPGFARFGIDLSFRVAGQTRQLLVDLDDRGDLRLARLLTLLPDGGDETAAAAGDSQARAAGRKILELAVPSAEVGLVPGEPAGLLVRLRVRGEEASSLREIYLKVPSHGKSGDAP